MEQKLRFRNSKGQFSSENTNHGILIETEYYDIEIRRYKQQEPNGGNGVLAQAKILCKKDVPNFKATVFNYRFWESGRSAGDTFLKTSESKKTWRDAINSIYEETIKEIELLDSLIKEREKALEEAEL